MTGINLRDYVPRFGGEYLRDILAEYAYVVRINARYMNLSTLQPMESWCDEHFGKLDEYTSYSPWQVSIDVGIPSKGKFIDVLCFHFHDEINAMAFKLRWI